MASTPILAIDIGGTKTLVALVEDGKVLARQRIETDRKGGAEAWLDALAAAASTWRGRFHLAGAAVTGRIADGCWSALNPLVLPVPARFPLVETLRERFGVPVVAANDAQAAAWGEYRFGAGQGGDLVFITVSTGLGGGLVLGGRLVSGRGGLAGHIGQMLTDPIAGDARLEDVASGLALARAGDPERLFAAAAHGDTAAETLICDVAIPLLRTMRSLQLLLDPDCFIIGGGLGLAEGFIARLRSLAAAIEPDYRPDIRAAALGPDAGLIGIADLARTQRASAPEVDR
jgi:predicted NBD/HSP70 family sugar kinase